MSDPTDTNWTWDELRAELHTERYTREQHEQTIRNLCDEIERLQGELDKAHRLLSQSIGWQHEVEVVKIKQQAEIERERDEARDDHERVVAMLLTEEAENDRLKAEIERLRDEVETWIAQAQIGRDEIERLKAALQDAARRYEAEGDADYMMVPIRAALDGGDERLTAPERLEKQNGPR